MGCGNGVLSLAAASLWGAHVTAVDISDNAIHDCRQHILAYGLQDSIEVHKSDRFMAPAISQNAPYDLIIANMLDQWLVEMAYDIKKHLSPGGYVILSGMLEWLMADTKRSYTNLEFEILEEFHSSTWHGCLLRLTS